MAKQIVQIAIEKTVLDGTEILEMQEAAGGAGSSKKFSLANLASTFLNTLFASKAQGGKADTAVQSVVAGSNIVVDNTNPTNPTVGVSGVVRSVAAGSNIIVDSTDPANPIVKTNSDVVSTVKNSFSDQQTVLPHRAQVSGAVVIDLNTAKSNNIFLTITGNITSFQLANPIDGGVYNIRFIQDSVGGHTLTGTQAQFRFPGGVLPVLSTASNAVDFMSLQYGAVEGTYMCTFLQGMA